MGTEALATTSLRQWGNSKAIRIPKEVIEKSRIRETDTLEVMASNGLIIFQKQGRKKYSDIAKPLIDTANWKFDREEANER